MTGGLERKKERLLRHAEETSCPELLIIVEMTNGKRRRETCMLHRRVSIGEAHDNCLYEEEPRGRGEEEGMRQDMVDNTRHLAQLGNKGKRWMAIRELNWGELQSNNKESFRSLNELGRRKVWIIFAGICHQR